MDWIAENTGTILIAAGAFITGGLAIAKVTKNKTDDKVFGLLKQVLDSLTSGKK